MKTGSSYSKEYYYKNKKRILERQKEYAEKNKEKRKRWVINNKEI